MPNTSYGDRFWDLERRRHIEHSVPEATRELQRQVPTGSMSLQHSFVIGQVEGEHGSDLLVQSHNSHVELCV